MGTAWEELSLYDRFVYRRQVDMEKDREPFDKVREEVVHYLRPDLTGNADTDTGKPTGKIVDSTGAFDANIMSNWFVGNLVGPSLDWIRYRMSDRRLKGNDVFSAFLQRSAEFMLEDVYPYPYSNFYETNNNFALDGITIGSPVMLLEEDPVSRNKITTIPHYTENYLMRDWFGNDVAYHRKWKVTNFAAMQAFGDSLPFNIQTEISQGQLDIKHTYLMCIARAGDAIFKYENPIPENTIPLLRPWMQLWFAVPAGDITQKLPLNYRLAPPEQGGGLLPTTSPGYWHKPFHAWHYKRLSFETYSRTPGWSALPDVKGLNQAWRTIHEVAQQKARPAVSALEKLKGKLHLGAEGVTWLENMGDEPKAYNDNANYSWAMDFIDGRTKTVGRHFFADMARMIETYSRDHKQPPTAYQLSQMISETMVLVGPAITGYAGPFLNAIDEQFLELEMRSGRFFAQTEPPDEILETSGVMQPVFTGPLIQALRGAMLSKRIQQPLTMAAPIFDIWPDAKHKIRAADLVEKILEGHDFPQDLIVGGEEYEGVMESVNAERQQQKALDNMEQMAKIVPELQSETNENSPLKAISEAA